MRKGSYYNDELLTLTIYSTAQTNLRPNKAKNKDLLFTKNKEQLPHIINELVGEST